MKAQVSIAQLLRWRLAQAELEAPPPPPAAHLLQLVRPWWETWPERFQSLVERLTNMQVAYGHAMAEPLRARSGHPVAALILDGTQELETTVRVLYLDIQGSRLRLRFQLDTAAKAAPEAFEVTFVSDTTSRPVLCAPATRSVNTDYRVDTELSDECARNWERLRVIERMPFRLILRSEQAGA